MSFQGKAGKIRETFRSRDSVSFEWILPKFSLMPKDETTSFYSPRTKVSDTEIKLKISPNCKAISTTQKASGFNFGNTKVENLSVPIYGVGQQQLLKLELLRYDYGERINFKLGFRGANDTEIIIVDNAEFLEYNASYVKSECLRSDFLDLSDTLTVVCKLWCKISPFKEVKTLVSCETQTEIFSNTSDGEKEPADVGTKGIFTLQQQLKELLLSGDDHDIIFKVKNQELKAHRNVLRARSPKFAAMFRHEMKEKAGDPISIEGYEPEAFDEFLRYIYTGKIENMSVKIAMGTYYLADTYDVPNLKDMCIEFLKSSLSTNVVCDVIALAIEFSETSLQESAVSFFSKHMEEVMVTIEWQRFITNNPIQASELCLAAVKTSYKKIE